MTNQTNKLFALFFFLFIFGYLFIFQLKEIWPFTVDDMYITLRYAKNWASGSGLLWNVGESPVEGYSNFSFVVLGCISIFFGLDPVVTLKCTGVFGLFISCVAVYLISRFWFSRRIALIPCVWLLAYKGQIIWTASGLETTLYEGLLVFSVVFIFKGLGYNFFPGSSGPYRPIYFISAGFLLAIASLTRPEAPVLMGLFVFILFFSVFSSRNQPLSTTHEILKSCVQLNYQLSIFILVFLIFYLPYFVWRWHYFGRIFPNPVYCKGFSSSLSFILDKQYLLLCWPFVLLAAPAVYKANDIRCYFLLLPSVVYGLLLINASELVAFDNRLFLPAFALLLPLSLQGLTITLETVFLKFNLKRRGLALYVCAITIIILFIPMLTLNGYAQFTHNPLAGEQLRTRVLAWLKNNAKLNTRVVLGDSGMIPFYSSLQYIDSYCLNNALMTQGERVDMYDQFCKTIFTTQPEVFVLTSLTEKGRTLYTPADACLINMLKRSPHYELKANLQTDDPTNFYRYEIYKIHKS